MGRLDPDVAAARNAVREVLADLPPGSPVLVALSGGADSLALAAAAAFVGDRTGRPVGAVVVDHGLQVGSADVARRAAAQARDLGLHPVEVVAVAVGADGGPEGAARAARRAALSRAAVQHGAVAVLLGHTLDDQAETVLLGLARGSGARSLAGMAAVDGLWRRPFLHRGRTASTAVCAAHDLVPWDDPHNADPAYARSRVRAGALPALVAALGPGAVGGLARTAALLRADADHLDRLAAAAGDDLRRPVDGAGSVGLHVAGTAALPDALRTRVLRRAALDAGAPPGDLAAHHVGEVDRLLTHWHGQHSVELPGAVVVRRVGDRLVLAGRVAP